MKVVYNVLRATNCSVFSLFWGCFDCCLSTWLQWQRTFGDFGDMRWEFGECDAQQNQKGWRIKSRLDFKRKRQNGGLTKERNPLFFLYNLQKNKTKIKDKLLFSPAGDFHNSTFISKNLCMANASILLQKMSLFVEKTQTNNNKNNNKRVLVGQRKFTWAHDGERQKAEGLKHTEAARTNKWLH